MSGTTRLERLREAHALVQAQVAADIVEHGDVQRLLERHGVVGACSHVYVEAAQLDHEYSVVEILAPTDALVERLSAATTSPPARRVDDGVEVVEYVLADYARVRTTRRVTP